MSRSQKQPDSDMPHEQEYESYGWEFHKIPLLCALILTGLFYAFIFIYFNM